MRVVFFHSFPSLYQYEIYCTATDLEMLEKYEYSYVEKTAANKILPTLNAQENIAKSAGVLCL